jgi:hypothetical protein
LVQRLNSSMLECSSVGIIAGEIKSMITVFTEAPFVHMNRSLNEQVNTLAKLCLSVSSSEVLNFVPKCNRKIICIHVI